MSGLRRWINNAVLRVVWWVFSAVLWLLEKLGIEI